MERIVYADYKKHEGWFCSVKHNISSGYCENLDAVKGSIGNVSMALVGRESHSAMFFPDEPCEGHERRVRVLRMERASIIKAYGHVIDPTDFTTVAIATKEWG